PPFSYDCGRRTPFGRRRRDELWLGQFAQVVFFVVGRVQSGGKFLFKLGRDGAAHPSHLDEDRLPVLVAPLHAGGPTALLMAVRALPDEFFALRVIGEPLEHQRCPSVRRQLPCKLVGVGFGAHRERRVAGLALQRNPTLRQILVSNSSDPQIVKAPFQRWHSETAVFRCKHARTTFELAICDCNRCAANRAPVLIANKTGESPEVAGKPTRLKAKRRREDYCADNKPGSRSARRR